MNTCLKGLEAKKEIHYRLEFLEYIRVNKKLNLGI